MFKGLVLFAASMVISATGLASECFNPSFAQSWSYDSKTEVLSVKSFDTVYQITTFGSCTELAWANTVGFRSFFGSQVCGGDRVLAIDAFGRVTQVCTIDTIEKSGK